MGKLRFCQFGAGRIGQIHAKNIAEHPRGELRWVVDVDADAAAKLAHKYGARPTTDAAEALADAGTDAVVIASATNTHVDLIVAAARANKAVFCEKPVDLELGRVDFANREVERAGVPFFIAFNRRFDPSFAALRESLRRGAIGKVESVLITSRDPSPPPPAYVRVSGGLFRDMMIHDFDMARWLLGEEPVELYAQGSCLVDPEIGAAGDIDTAMVVMKTASGSLCQISNSRRAAYGYDQRVEVLGAKGMLQAANVPTTTLSTWTADGVVADKPLHFFLERYGAAYRAEIDHFIAGVLDRAPLSAGVQDGRRALLLAEAALRSLERGAAVRVE